MSSVSSSAGVVLLRMCICTQMNLPLLNNVAMSLYSIIVFKGIVGIVNIRTAHTLGRQHKKQCFNVHEYVGETEHIMREVLS